MKQYILLPLLAITLISCGKGSDSSLSRVDYTSNEVSSEIEGESTTSIFLPPTEEDFVNRYLAKMSSYNTYKAVTKGSTTAKVLFIETSQSIDVTLIKSEYSYLLNESHSSFVNTVHKAYFHNNNVVYKDNDNEYKLDALSDYLNTYGVYPFDPTIEGYICSDTSITSVEKLEVETGYAFKISFDVEKATSNVRIQMKAFGGLDDYPSFHSINISVYTKDDLTPDYLEVNAEYNAKKGIDSACVQNYKVTFSNFDEEIDVPNLTDIKSQFDF